MYLRDHQSYGSNNNGFMKGTKNSKINTIHLLCILEE